MGHVQRGPQISVKFFKQEITGTRPLAIFIVGASLVIFSLNILVQIMMPSQPSESVASIVPDPVEGQYREVLPYPDLWSISVVFLSAAFKGTADGFERCPAGGILVGSAMSRSMRGVYQNTVSLIFFTPASHIYVSHLS